MSKSGAPHRRWAFDNASFAKGSTIVPTIHTQRYRKILAASAEAKTEVRNDPSGFIQNFVHNEAGDAGSRRKGDDMIYQSAMAIGMNAGKQLAFTAFALYMSGNSLHIFSIFALGMAIMSPINGLMGFANAFARYSDSNVNLIVPKVLYVLSQLGGILLVLYKFNNLGLLPNSPIDLISSLPPPIVRLSRFMC